MIPDYQTLMRPLLECIQDGQEHLFKNVIEQLADRFELTQEEREQLAPSGHRALFFRSRRLGKNLLKEGGTARTEKKRDTLDHLSGNKGFKIQKENRRNLPDGIPEFRRFLRPCRPATTRRGKTSARLLSIRNARLQSLRKRRSPTPTNRYTINCRPNCWMSY